MLPMGTRLRNPRRSNVASPIAAPVSTWTQFTPAALQPALWLDASDASTITESSGSVSEWRDKSANVYAFTQATSTAQPTTGSTTQNGLNVLSFDGVSQTLLSSAAASTWSFLHNGTHFIYGVVLQRAVISVAHIHMQTTATIGGVTQPGFAARHLANNTVSFIVVNNNQSATPGNNAVVNATTTATTSTSPRVITAHVRPDTVSTARCTILLDGAIYQQTQGSAATPTTVDPYTSLYIGSNAGASGYWNGWIAEIVVLTGSAVTENNRQRLHEYLNRKWAVY